MHITVMRITLPSLNVLLYGDPALSLEINTKVLQAVHKFIATTERFYLLLQRSCDYTLCSVLLYSVLYALSADKVPLTINYVNVLLT